MGRRSVRSPDPTLDLSHHLRVLDEWAPVDGDRPCSVTDWISGPAPLEIEVGSGKGLFLVSAARRAPHGQFLGIELAARYARHAAGRLAAAGLDNGRIVQGDAKRFLRDCVPSDTIAAVHVYFPDPWWKKRHKKRRVLDVAFLRDVERVLAPRGRFHFWTDVREYFDSTLDLVRLETGLEGPHPVDERPAEHDLDYRTHFERRTRLGGQRVHRCWYGKAGDGPDASADQRADDCS
ncbi:MAG: tRNA (guanosine(46)-N7)-methyltransferase TrmB [Planctomycetes bacterium]|nr:tRNA (guanosine(46)-N7)-methyltransferase TrmB [Planctomycetota bacterium]